MAVIIIPLTPGYPMPMDSPDAGAVRMIMEAQARSMYRGEHSVFARLRRAGIEPAEYINFFSLRAWGKMQSGHLVSQDIYIHDKIMIVDDRLAIIGSANINERSMRGDRDSELACVIRDTDMIDSTMAGVPFKVGRFAHTMRIRLMREHIGIDVDAMLEEKADTIARESKSSTNQSEDNVVWDPESEQVKGDSNITSSIDPSDRYATGAGMAKDLAGAMVGGAGEAMLGAAAQPGRGAIPRLARTHDQKDKSTRHEQPDQIPHAGESLEDRVTREATGNKAGPEGSTEIEPSAEEDPSRSALTEDELNKKVGEANVSNHPSEQAKEVPYVHSPAQAKSKATARARNVNLSFAQSHASTSSLGISSPNDEATSRHQRTLSASTRQSRSGSDAPPMSSISRTPNKSHPYTLPFPIPDIDPFGLVDPLDERFYKDVWMRVAARNTEIFRKVFRCTPDDKCLTWTQFKEWDLWEKRHAKPFKDSGGMERSGSNPGHEGEGSDAHRSHMATEESTPVPDARKSKIKLTDEGFTKNEIELMENLLSELRGNLVMYPIKFLESEAMSGNNLFSRDRIQPMAVYD